LIMLGWSTPIVPCDSVVGSDLSVWVVKSETYVLGILYVGGDPLGLTYSSILRLNNELEVSPNYYLMSDSSETEYVESTSFTLPDNWIPLLSDSSILTIIGDKGSVEFTLPESVANRIRYEEVQN
jgi:hypothetical protein